MTTNVGLVFPKSLSYDEWENAGWRVARIASSAAWFIGDWVACGQVRYDNRYRAAIELVGLDYQTIRNYAWVARTFDIGRRREKLSFQHHAEVASMPSSKQDYWLNRAEQLGWSRNQLRRQLRVSQRAGDAEDQRGVVQPLTVDRDRMARWLKAAESAGCTLEVWMISCLDSAADGVLPDESQPAAAVNSAEYARLS